MPRYFFHRAAGAQDPDNEGVELAGLDDAWGEAVLFLIDTLKDRRYSLRHEGEFRIDVSDSSQTAIFSITVSSRLAVPAAGEGG